MNGHGCAPIKLYFLKQAVKSLIHSLLNPALDFFFQFFRKRKKKKGLYLWHLANCMLSMSLDLGAGRKCWQWQWQWWWELTWDKKNRRYRGHIQEGSVVYKELKEVPHGRTPESPGGWRRGWARWARLCKSVYSKGQRKHSGVWRV